MSNYERYDGSNKRCFNPPSNGHICFCERFQHNSACTYYILKKHLDFYEPDHCYGPGPEMMCIAQYLYPTCLSFHEGVSKDEWRMCLDRPELYQGEGYDYSETILKMADGSRTSSTTTTPLKIIILIVLISLTLF